MKYLLMAFLLLLSVSASAFQLCGDNPRDDRWLRLGMWSAHHGRHNTDDQNEEHNQVGLDYGQCTVLYMKNSDSNDTYIAARRSMLNIYDKSPMVKITGGLIYGVVYASENYINGQRVSVMALPLIQIEVYDRISIDFYSVPSVVTAIGFRFKF